MNILRAEQFVKTYGSRHVVLNELYPDDDMLQDALQVMFPEFELDKFAHLTLGEIIEQYEVNPQPLHT